MELRKHQQKAIDMIEESFLAGHKRVLLAAPCSFGKTIVAAHIMKQCQDEGLRGAFICDRIKLIDQTVNAFKSYGVSFGVLQGHHELENDSKPIQIVSVQTLARRKDIDPFDVIIIDECHTQYTFLQKYLANYPNAFVIGLSATPYSRKLGDYFTDLLLPITTRSLLDQGYLAPVRYFVGRSVDTSKIKKKALPTGGSDYNPDELGEASLNDKTLLGDIVKNWLLHGEGKQTIAFSPSIKQSKFLVDKFIKAGVTAKHIDCYMSPQERRQLFKDHNAGKFKILSNAKLLNTGYDEPSVACLIDCYPTRSKINIVQRYGRVMRIADNKPYAIVLDHAKNVHRHGLVEDLVPTRLHQSMHQYKEDDLVKSKKKKEPSLCPQCASVMNGPKCSNCGYESPKVKLMRHTDEMLIELEKQQLDLFGKTKKMKQDWYSDLVTLCHIKGYKRGWAYKVFEEKFGEPPLGLSTSFSPGVSDEVKNYVKYLQIKRAYSRKKLIKQ